MITFEAIGTHWTIDAPDELKEIILKRIAAFDLLYSRFRDDSWVTKLSLEAGTYDLPADAEPMFSLYRDLYKITDGYVTPLIGQVLVDAGYDKDYSFKQIKPLTQPPVWDDVIEYAPPKIIMKKPALLDVGALGKGYLVDIIGSVLEKEGIKDYCIDAGGDILHKNEKGDSIRIGLEHPEDFKKVIGVFNLKNKREGKLCLNFLPF